MKLIYTLSYVCFFFIILCHCGRKPKSNEAFATSSCDSDFSLNFDCCACDQKENICGLNTGLSLLFKK